MTSADVLAIVALVATVVFGVLSVWYARDAATVGREALRLAKAQAESAPHLEVSLDAGDKPFIVTMQRRAPKAKKRSGIYSQLDIRMPGMPGDGEDADALLPLNVYNAGSKPANGLTGWLRFSPAFVKPVDQGFSTSLNANYGWSVSEKDEYEVHVYDRKVTPGTSATFGIPINGLAAGECAVDYEFVCDEGIRLEGRLNIVIQE